MGCYCTWRIRTDIYPADIGTKPLGPYEFEPKARLVLEGIEDLDYEDVERKLTEPNDASV